MFAYATGTLRYVLQNHNQDSYRTITPFLRVLRLFPSKLSKISHLPWELNFSAKFTFFGQSLSHGYYQPTYQVPEGLYSPNVQNDKNYLLIFFVKIIHWWLFSLLNRPKRHLFQCWRNQTLP